MTHRKTVKHYESVRCVHELTFSCYRRMPLLTLVDGVRAPLDVSAVAEAVFRGASEAGGRQPSTR